MNILSSKRQALETEKKSMN